MQALTFWWCMMQLNRDCGLFPNSVKANSKTLDGINVFEGWLQLFG